MMWLSMLILVLEQLASLLRNMSKKSSGVEVIPEAVENSKKNAQLNNIQTPTMSVTQLKML